MKTKLVVACDLDDVLADFITRFISISREVCGKPKDRYARPVDWAWSNFDINPEEMKACFAECAKIPDFHRGLEILPGVDERLVNRLSIATSMVFPTARFDTLGHSTQYQSAQWLWDNFNIRFPTVIVANDKGPLAAALKYDYFIDDRPKNVLEVKEARPECKVFLADSCHNQNFNHPDIQRVSGFNSFARRILHEVGHNQ